MAIQGQLTSKNSAGAIPSVAPPFKVSSERNYTDVDILRLDYLTDGKAAAAFLPEEFEVDDYPNASFQFNSFGFSNAGTYLEAVQSVECSFEGKKFFFPLRLYLSCDTPMVAGREWFGIPKLGGVVHFDPSQAASILSGRLERPAGILLATGVFRPDSLIGPVPNITRETWGLRSMPGATPDSPSSLRELVGYRLRMSGGTSWKGEGTVNFTAASSIDPIHRLPVSQMQACTFFRKVDFALEPTGRVVDLRG